MRLAFSVAIAALATAAAPAAATSPSVDLSFTAATGGAIFPPDTHGAVGPDHAVVLINGQYRVFDKRDGAPLAQSSLSTFWLAAGVSDPAGPFDPRVFYDAASARWFAVSVNRKQAPNEILVAVSMSDDPLDGWIGFAIDSDALDLAWADFPMLGFDAVGVYVAVPMVRVVGDPELVGVDVLILPKQDLLAAAPSIANATLYENVPPLSLGVVPQPVVDLDGGALPEQLVSGVLGPTGVVQIAEIAGTITAPVVNAAFGVAVTPFDLPPPGRQPGSKPDLETNPGDARFSSSVVERGGSLWAVHAVAAQGRAALRMLELDAATGAARQDLLLGDPVLDLYYPSIAVGEDGAVVIGMSGSSESDFVGAYALVGETVGGVTSFGPLLALRDGDDDYRHGVERNRWGDYSATVVDPTDPQRFWTFQEYVHGRDQWGVHVAAIRVPESDGVPLALAALLALAAARARQWA